MAGTDRSGDASMVRNDLFEDASGVFLDHSRPVALDDEGLQLFTPERLKHLSALKRGQTYR